MPMPNDTKEKLEIEALRYFAKHDYERSSLNDIAEELGVTKGAIYHYFKNKDDLFRACVERLMDIMETAFTGSMPVNIPLRTVLEGLFDVENVIENVSTQLGLDESIFAHDNSYYLLLAAMKKFPGLRERVDSIYLGFRKNLEAVMAKALSTGEIRKDTDIEAVAYEITAFYEGALLLDSFTGTKAFPVLGRRVCNSIMDRIAPEGGR